MTEALPALNPTELSDFLAKKHIERTDDEYTQFIELLRQERGAYVAALAEGKKSVRAPSAKVARKLANANLPSPEDLFGEAKAEGRIE